MLYGFPLRARRSADVRVLKAQLDLVADVLRAARFTGPVWALALACLGSDAFGFFGHQRFGIALIFAAAVAIVCTAASRIARIYQIEMTQKTSRARLQVWLLRFVIMQAAISIAWSSMPWLLWTPGDNVNHMFIAGCVSGILGSVVISRCNHLDMLLASLVPMACFSTARMFFGGTLFDFGLATIIPILAVQFFVDGTRLTRRIDNSRLRFEVEDLADELEDARDEALRKRFEAETANASKTSFLANMSHELRTPLNAILGFSEIIAKECFGPVGSPRYRDYASDIHSSGAHLLSLINDLLDVAKIESGRMEIYASEVDVGKCFDSMLTIVEGEARERKQELFVALDPLAPPLLADERALKQILLNLVSNAIKFTPEGGRICVSGGRAECGSFQIMVEDNGPGVPREKLDTIFKPFAQVDNRYDRQGGGTGLGLALVRGLAELHGGRAWLESELGKGCRVFVLLPAAAVSAAA